MFDIVRRKNMALRELGELPIREHTSAPVGKKDEKANDSLVFIRL
jgi:hypothetical protein